MKKLVLSLLIVASAFSVKAQSNNPFPTTDSLVKYINKWVRNSPIDAFSNLRLNTAMIGITRFIQESYGGKITGFSLSGDTLKITTTDDELSVVLSAGGGGTNLTFSRNGTTLTVISSSGTDVTLPGATQNNAGVLTAADKIRIDSSLQLQQFRDSLQMFLRISDTSDMLDGYLNGNDTLSLSSRINLRQPAGNYITDLNGDVLATGPVGGGSANAVLSNTTVTPGEYLNANIVVDSKGRITSASNGTGGGSGTDNTNLGTGYRLLNTTSQGIRTIEPTGTILWDSTTNSLRARVDTSAGKIATKSDLLPYQPLLGFTPENVANKSTSTTLGTSNTLYPTQLAAKTYMDNIAVTKQDLLGYTPENIANKSTNTALGNSNTLYPTQNAAKTYTDNGLATKQDVIPTGTINQYFRGDLSLATFPTNLSSFTNGPGYITNITGLITPGTNVSMTGNGTPGSPYVINATPGGGGGSVTSFGFLNGGGFTGSVSNSTSTPVLSLSLNDNAVTYSKIQQGTARSVLAVPGNSASDYQAVQGTTNQVLRISADGASLGFGTLNLSSSAAVSGTLSDTYIASAATWNAKQNAITLTTTGSGAATLIGNTLNIPVSGGSGTVNTGAANTLAYYSASGTVIDDLTAITANRALISNANGLPVASSVTATTLGYLDATSSVQTQLNSKQPTITTGTTSQYLRGDLSLATFPTNVTSFTNDAGYISNITGKIIAGSNVTITGSGTTASPYVVNATGGGGGLYTFSGGLTESGGVATIADLGVTNSKVATGIDAIKIGAGNVSNTEFNYLDGVTSNIQTQFAGKQNTITTGTTAQYFRGDLSLATFPTALSSFTNDPGFITASSTNTLTNKTWNGAAIADAYISSAATWNAKQDALVSGTNIKTINGASILGSGNLVVSGSKWTQGSGYIYNNTDNVAIGASTNSGDKLRVVGSVRFDLGSDATGDLLYRGSLGSLERRAAPSGLTTPMLSYSSGAPVWVEAPTGGGGGPSTTINNNADTRIVTGSNTANTLNANAGLTFSDYNLQINAPSGSNPFFRLSDGDVTPSNFTGNATFVPALGANVIGLIAGVSPGTSGYGGMQLTGFTNNTASALPMLISGYIGHTTPTGSSLFFRGGKWNGTNSIVALAATEKLVTFNNWTTEVANINGAGTPKFIGLAGTGDRMVVAASDGTLSTQAIPGGGSGGSNLAAVLTAGQATGPGQYINFEATSGTARSVMVTNRNSETDNLSLLSIRPFTGNSSPIVEIMPANNGYSSVFKSALNIYNTSRAVDPVNYEAFTLRAAGTNGYIISSEKGGTGTLRDINFQVAGVNALSISGSTNAVTLNAGSNTLVMPTTRPGTNGYVPSWNTTGAFAGWVAPGGGGGSGTVTNVSGGTTGLSFSNPTTTPTMSGILSKANGGTGTSSPNLSAGTGISVTGTWPNQTITNTHADGSIGMTFFGSVTGATTTSYTGSLQVDNGEAGIMELYFVAKTSDGEAITRKLQIAYNGISASTIQFFDAEDAYGFRSTNPALNGVSFGYGSNGSGDLVLTITGVAGYSIETRCYVRKYPVGFSS